MPIELRITVGDAAPRVETHDAELLTLGRDPSSDIRFDLAADLQVSTRHAEIRREDGQYFISDRGSTNGTWVNGARVSSPRRIRAGDIIHLGNRGPSIRVAQLDDEVWHETAWFNAMPPILDRPPPRREPTQEIVTKLVAKETRRIGLVGVVIVGAMLVVVGLGWSRLGSVSADPPDVWREVTMPAIRRANEDAIALLEVRIAGTLCVNGCEGTAFAVDSSGLLVTNRHVVEQAGRRAQEIRAKFANSAQWIRARLVGLHPDPTVDLALVQLEVAGRYPAVAGLSERGLDLPIGSGVLTIGFPLGTALRMDGAGEAVVARTTTTTGAVAKVLADVVQIDASATHGSSGSPVFDRHGHAIGVVTGGARDDTPNIVYIVPSGRVHELLAAHLSRARRPAPSSR